MPIPVIEQALAEVPDGSVEDVAAAVKPAAQAAGAWHSTSLILADMVHTSCSVGGRVRGSLPSLVTASSPLATSSSTWRPKRPGEE